MLLVYDRMARFRTLERFLPSLSSVGAGNSNFLRPVRLLSDLQRFGYGFQAQQAALSPPPFWSCWAL